MSVKAKLPAKLSDLIDVAVKDLGAVERSKKYRVNMNSWHTPSGFTRQRCDVCFAGAVMAQSLGGDPDGYLFPSSFDKWTKDRMFALDGVRANDLAGALFDMKVSPRRVSKITARPDIPHVPQYSKRKSPAFKSALRKLARILRQEGL